MQREFADVIQKISERQGGEVPPAAIMQAFRTEYLESKAPFEFQKLKVVESEESDDVHVELAFKYMGEQMHSVAEGNGPIDAVKLAIRQCVSAVDIKVLNYWEHALSEGSHAKAAAYIQMRDNRTGKVTFGVGVSSNITHASIKGVFSALNRLAK